MSKTVGLDRKFWKLKENTGLVFDLTFDPSFEERFEFGERGPIEFELNTMVREYRISWDKDSEISAELARLRWEKKWTVKRIAEHMGVSYDSANMRLRRLARHR